MQTNIETKISSYLEKQSTIHKCGENWEREIPQKREIPLQKRGGKELAVNHVVGNSGKTEQLHAEKKQTNKKQETGPLSYTLNKNKLKIKTKI